MKVIKTGNPECEHKLVTMRYELPPPRSEAKEVRTCCVKCGRVEIGSEVSKPAANLN